MGSQGNGLISRSIIHHVSYALKTTAPENILVGIAWSGPDRYDFYADCDLSPIKKNIDEWMENPTRFNKHSDKKWVILNYSWRNEIAKKYYSTFHSDIGSLIYTIEHILRVQWFLKLHNIKYFMTTYTSEVLTPQCNHHPDLKPLYEQIDFDTFLPIEGIYEWCRDYSELPFITEGDNHPSALQHQRFTKEVILPFLNKKEYI